MSTINEDNLDALMFDHLEGNLDPETSADLLEFLARHPEYAEDWAAWQATRMKGNAVPTAYPGVQGLVRPVNGFLGAGSAGLWSAIAGTVVVAGLLSWWMWFGSPDSQDKRSLNIPEPAPETELIDSGFLNASEAGEQNSRTSDSSVTAPLETAPPGNPHTSDPVIATHHSRPLMRSVADDSSRDEWNRQVMEMSQRLIDDMMANEEAVPSVRRTILPSVLPGPPDSLPADSGDVMGSPEILQNTPREKRSPRQRKKVRVVPLKSDAF